MPLELSWQDVALRLALTVLAGGLIGLNREERANPAGLRTCLLVCLAASLAMIQANLLLATTKRPPQFFDTMDVMRLPLGILSGIGFIGAGAIVHRGSMTQGVTTAATLWFVTVMGLCLGGGQLGLGLAALGLGLFVLSLLKWVDRNLKEERRAKLIAVAASDGPTEKELRGMIEQAGLRVTACAIDYLERRELRKMRFEVLWRSRETDLAPPPLIEQLAARSGMVKLRWEPNA